MGTQHIEFTSSPLSAIMIMKQIVHTHSTQQHTLYYFNEEVSWSRGPQKRGALGENHIYIKP